VSDFEKLVDTLDVLYRRLNTIVTTSEFIFVKIIPSVIEELKSLGCAYHSLHYNDKTNTIYIYFSYNDNKSCIGVVLDLHQIRDSGVRIKSHYYIQGAPCDFKL